MNVVVDASVIIAVIANQPEKGKLIRLTKGADLISPAAVNWEIGNTFSAMLKQKRISLEQAIQAIELYRCIPIRFVEVELGESLQIAAETNLYAYDAYLIRCALKYSSALISLDRNLMRAAQAMNVEVLEVRK